MSTRKTPASAASKKRPTKRARSSAGKSKSLIDLQRAHERDADDSARSRGLGDLRALPDELLVSMLGLLPPDQVARMCTLSKVFRCFCEFSELWKGFVLEVSKGPGGLIPMRQGKRCSMACIKACSEGCGERR